MSIFTKSFSALQRAENSQWHVVPAGDHLEDEVSVLFSEPKILNVWHRAARWAVAKFQCSSASRKFSIQKISMKRRYTSAVSVLFSEPKILNPNVLYGSEINDVVSVLFSEPKILN